MHSIVSAMYCVAYLKTFFLSSLALKCVCKDVYGFDFKWYFALRLQLLGEILLLFYSIHKYTMYLSFKKTK